MIRKTYSIPDAVLKANDDNGVVEAYVSVTGNLDYQRDIIHPGAYARQLKEGKAPKIAWNHRLTESPLLGKTLDYAEVMPGDARLPQSLKHKGYGGLYVKGEFNLDKEFARDTFSDIKKGILDEFSVQFGCDEKAANGGYEMDRQGVRHIKAIFPLLEWSPVPFGANADTLMVGVKAADLYDIDEIVDMLQKAGLMLTDLSEQKNKNDHKPLKNTIHDMATSIHDAVCALGADCDCSYDSGSKGRSSRIPPHVHDLLVRATAKGITKGLRRLS